MATNKDSKWFVGQFPVSSAYVGGTQVYPADSGGGDGDAHIVVISGSSITRYLPTPSTILPSYVAINGVEVAPKTYYTALEMKEGDVVEFICDWDNPSTRQLNWIREIRNIGLNSITGKRHQVVNGYRAFFRINVEGSPMVEHTGLASLDTSNLTTMKQMFENANGYCDASGWDTSNITDIYGAFQGQSRQFFYPEGARNWKLPKATDGRYAFSGNQFVSGQYGGKPALDISGWCVTGMTWKPSYFDKDISWDEALQPDWGTCP